LLSPNSEFIDALGQPGGLGLLVRNGVSGSRRGKTSDQQKCGQKESYVCASAGHKKNFARVLCVP
jgi:hypothetical protein